MKGLRTIIPGMLTACMLQACNHPAKNYNKTLTADSDTTVTDTTTTLNLQTDKDDTEFAIEAISGGTTEVTLGKLAIQKGRSKKVKNFGTMMVKEHTKLNNKLLALIKAKAITLTVTPDAKDQTIINQLSKKSGTDFDKAYISYMTADHQNDVKLFTAESKKLQDPDLKAFAVKALPILQNHLDAINAIHDSMRN